VASVPLQVQVFAILRRTSAWHGASNAHQQARFLPRSSWRSLGLDDTNSLNQPTAVTLSRISV
jgi:hypothetical protein